MVTLRSAINSGVSSIDFDANLSGGTINLGSQLKINKSVTINNTTGGPPITLMGNGTFGLIYTASGTNDEIDNLEMDQGGGVNSGGGIDNNGTLMLNGCYMRLNSASNTGGAIFNENSGTLQGQRVSNPR